MNKLEPCPFCGGKAGIRTISNESTHSGVGFEFNIRCTECGVRLPKRYEVWLELDGETGEIITTMDEREKAINEWNMRGNNESN